MKHNQDAQRFDQRQLPPKPEYKGRCCWTAELTRRPQRVDERPLASGWRTYASICWIRRTDWGRKHSVLPWLLQCRYFLDSMTERTTMSGRPITWIHWDAPFVSGRIHSHSLEPYNWGHLPSDTGSWNYQLFLGVESDLTASLIFCVEHSLSERREFGIMGIYYHIWKWSVLCESFRRALRNRSLRLAFHSLLRPHRYKEKRSLWISCQMVVWGHLSNTNVWFQPKLSCIVQILKMSLLEEQCKPSRWPSSRQHSNIWERRTVSESLI